MSIETIYILIGLFLAAGLTVLSFVGLLKWNAYLLKTGKHPQLRYMIVQAITLAYKMSDAVFDETDKRLHWENKREVLEHVYALLPNPIHLMIFDIDWKNLVSTDQFIGFVSEQYDELVEQWGLLRNRVLEEMVEAIGE